MTKISRAPGRMMSNVVVARFLSRIHDRDFRAVFSIDRADRHAETAARARLEQVKSPDLLVRPEVCSATGTGQIKEQPQPTPHDPKTAMRTRIVGRGEHASRE